MDKKISEMNPKERARYMVNQYTLAEIAILDGAQAYSIDGKSLTRANLSEIRRAKQSWVRQLNYLNGKSPRRYITVSTRG